MPKSGSFEAHSVTVEINRAVRTSPFGRQYSECGHNSKLRIRTQSFGNIFETPSCRLVALEFVIMITFGTVRDDKVSIRITRFSVNRLIIGLVQLKFYQLCGFTLKCSFITFNDQYRKEDMSSLTHHSSLTMNSHYCNSTLLNNIWIKWLPQWILHHFLLPFIYTPAIFLLQQNAFTAIKYDVNCSLVKHYYENIKKT